MCLVLLAAGDKTLNLTARCLWPGEEARSIFAIVLPEGLGASHLISLSFRAIFCKMAVVVTPLSSNNEKRIKCGNVQITSQSAWHIVGA